MNDITIIYYTASTLLDKVAEKVREHLVSVAGDIKIISVSQKPINLGTNICVGEIGQSRYNCQKQIYTGVKEVTTKYVACCEDDSLYNIEHFAYRPLDDAFGFNKSMWYLEGDKFWSKGHTGMFSCIAPTTLLVDFFSTRFKECPEEPMPREGQRLTWQEPGRLDDSKIEYFDTTIPLITFNFFASLGGKATSKVNKPEERTSLEYWGDAASLHYSYWK